MWGICLISSEDTIDFRQEWCDQLIVGPRVAGLNFSYESKLLRAGQRWVFGCQCSCPPWPNRPGYNQNRINALRQNASIVEDTGGKRQGAIWRGKAGGNGVPPA